MQPGGDDDHDPTPLPVQGCRYAIGCVLLLVLLFAMAWPWSGFRLYELLKPWGIRM
jgi:hypothetical protein